MEEWKYIEGYPNYQVSNFGRVKSLKFGKERILKPMVRSGYLRVELDSNAKSIHRLVCDCFHEKVEGKGKVNHKDGNKKNNNVANLEWCNDSENIRHAILNGLKPSSKGENNGQSKLKEYQVLEIRKSDKSSRELGRVYGVDKSIILDIKNRLTWKHI